MSSIEALLMGLVQGLTEYLPVSSSGHLAIAAALFGVDGEQNLTFTIAVHVATVLSTLVILWREVAWLVRGVLRWDGHLNEEQRYALCILISMVPVGIVGVFFKDKVEAVFGAGLMVVGICLLVTSALLLFSHFARPRQKAYIAPTDAFVIGLAQAVAVLPGISRSGSTIATGLLLGCRKEQLAQFSFLMVIPPILGEALLDILKAMSHGTEAATAGIGLVPLAIGFTAAFVSGCIACRWMINLVRRQRLAAFGIYCAIVGTLVILGSLTHIL